MFNLNNPHDFISIHAPAGGATKTSAIFMLLESIFQFTPLREGRLNIERFENGGSEISIHAPAGGATTPAP